MKATKYPAIGMCLKSILRSRGVSLTVQALLLFGVLDSVTLAASPLDKDLRFDIPENLSLEDALIEWGMAAGVTVMINTESVEHRAGHGVHGRLSAREALLILLRDSGLSYTEEGNRVRVLPAAGSLRATHNQVSGEVESATSSDYQTLYASNAESSVNSAESSESAVSSPNSLAEVVVTAEKREEKLTEVPIPIAVVDTAALVESNQTKIVDYFNQVPGLQLAQGIQSSQMISIRGITTGGENTTSKVGITLDGVPFGGDGSLLVPDFDPGDLARIEVLRGPQGTLYGSNSMGGLINFVTQDPSPTAFSGRIEAGADTIRNSPGLGYDVHGSFNIPITSTLAMRASAFTREDPGYIDNPSIGRDRVNVARASGAHLSFFWKPSEEFSAKLSALYQEVRGSGTSDIDTQSTITGGPLGDLQQGYVAGAGAYDRQLQAYSLILSGQIAGLKLESATGYNAIGVHDAFDATPSFGGPGGISDQTFGVLGSPVLDISRNYRFTEELRLSTTFANRVDFLLGAFYSRAGGTFDQVIEATDAQTGALAGQILYIGGFGNTGLGTEIAGFSDVTVHFNDKFDVQIGGRESRTQNDATDGSILIGPYVTDVIGLPSPLYTGPTRSFDDTATTYLFTPRYRISPDAMIYARLASGYEPGGFTGVLLPGIPEKFGPDSTRTYEVGSKTALFDKSLSIDVSVYYISWKSIQIGLVQAGTGENYTGNGGSAKSQGVEVSADWRPIDSLKIGGWLVFSDAQLTQNFPPIAVGDQAGFAGEQLPYSSRFSGTLSVDKFLPISDQWSVFGGALISYVGNRKDILQNCTAVNAQQVCISAPPRQDLPAYAKTDFHAGVKQGDSWTINAYVNNAFDRRGVLSGGPGNSIPYSFYIIPPRTIGVSVIREF